MTVNTKTRRNLILFIAVTIGAGWLGAGLDRLAPNRDATGTLGMGLWLVAPLLAALLLRAFAGDGWRDLGLWPALRHWRWYVFALLVYPACIAVALGLGGTLGVVSFGGLAAPGGAAAFARLLLAGAGANLVKNIFEEFAWRGYLTPRLHALRVNAFINHALTGVVWAGWHLPYWLFFVSQAQQAGYNGLSLPAFILAGFLTLATAAIAYGELRLLTGSVWPGYIMHTVGNALILTLLLQGLVTLQPGWSPLFTPGMEGGVVAFLFVLIGVALYRLRTQRALEAVAVMARPLAQSGPA